MGWKKCSLHLQARRLALDLHTVLSMQRLDMLRVPDIGDGRFPLGINKFALLIARHPHQVLKTIVTLFKLNRFDHEIAELNPEGYQNVSYLGSEHVADFCNPGTDLDERDVLRTRQGNQIGTDRVYNARPNLPSEIRGCERIKSLDLDEGFDIGNRKGNRTSRGNRYREVRVSRVEGIKPFHSPFKLRSLSKIDEEYFGLERAVATIRKPNNTGQDRQILGLQAEVSRPVNNIDRFLARLGGVEKDRSLAGADAKTTA